MRGVRGEAGEGDGEDEGGSMRQRGRWRQLRGGGGVDRGCSTMSDLLEYSSRIRVVHVSDYSEYE